MTRAGRLRRRPLLVLPLLAVAAWAVVGVAVAQRVVEGVIEVQAPPPNGTLVAGADGMRGFVVSGSLEGLHPGSDLRLRLSLANPNTTTIEVRDVRVAVRDAAPGCPAGLLEVAPLAAPVRVAGRSSTSAVLAVRLDERAGDACQGAAFGLRYSGSGVGL